MRTLAKQFKERHEHGENNICKITTTLASRYSPSSLSNNLLRALLLEKKKASRPTSSKESNHNGHKTFFGTSEYLLDFVKHASGITPLFFKSISQLQHIDLERMAYLNYWHSMPSYDSAPLSWLITFPHFIIFNKYSFKKLLLDCLIERCSHFVWNIYHMHMSFYSWILTLDFWMTITKRAVILIWRSIATRYSLRLIDEGVQRNTPATIMTTKVNILRDRVFCFLSFVYLCFILFSTEGSGNMERARFRARLLELRHP